MHIVPSQEINFCVGTDRPRSYRCDVWRYAILYACGGVYFDSEVVLA